MEAVLLVATWLFALTHIDTALVLIAFSADDEYSLGEILIGHYLGFSVGLGGAVMGSMFAAAFFAEWTFLLGFVPLTIGVWGVLQRREDYELTTPTTVAGEVERIGVVTTASIGISGENLAVFIPFFATLSSAELTTVIALYVVGAGVLFAFAVSVSKPLVRIGVPTWVDRWLLPTVLILVGSYVVIAGWQVA